MSASDVVVALAGVAGFDAPFFVPDFGTKVVSKQT